MYVTSVQGGAVGVRTVTVSGGVQWSEELELMGKTVRCHLTAGRLTEYSKEMERMEFRRNTFVTA